MQRRGKTRLSDERRCKVAAAGRSGRRERGQRLWWLEEEHGLGMVGVNINYGGEGFDEFELGWLQLMVMVWIAALDPLKEKRSHKAGDQGA
ncbi:hypothetical protein M0R45_009114 [Rubus argutus]|uniref:Uncharacterized protein n=1 Tax=Rubus argutus TaxID=59490 RepID=A0AAW1Y320_RUBAR